MGNVIEGKFKRSPQLPWSPIDDKDQEFWCERLGIYGFLTPEILFNGERATYHIAQTGVARGRVYPVLAHEIIPAESKAAKKVDLQGNELFPINRSNFDQIKNFLVDNFIGSYPWENTAEKTHDEIKKSMISLAKAPRNGITRQLEDERMQGYFLDKATFVHRMKPKLEHFPWDKLADFLDYSVPQT